MPDIRDGMIDKLKAAGMWARARDWGMGATVIVGSKAVTDELGITSIQRYTCMTPFPNGQWRLDVGGINGETFADADSAVQALIEILSLPEPDYDAVVKRNYDRVRPK